MSRKFRAALLVCCAMPGGTAFAQQAETPAPAEAAAQPADAPPAADAAQTDAAPPADDNAGNEVVVTASRAAPDGFSAPSPTTVVSSEALTRQSTTNISQFLNELPAFKATLSPSSNGSRPTNPGAAPADLRGIGFQRTLVLVNGSRLIPQAVASSTSAATAPDLNQIPTIMIDRIEVVTGGASAQWGSDAVAGVVNVLLRREYEGLQVTAQAGTSEVGDFREVRLAALGGFNFADGRGHVVAAIDYFNASDPGDYYSRDWLREEWQVVSNPGFATNGMPALILSPNVHVNAAPGSFITGPAAFALRGQQFLPGGILVPFDSGTLSNGTFQIGGEGRIAADGARMAPTVRRYSPYLRVGYEFSDAISAYVEASYATLRSRVSGFNPRDFNMTVRADNAFLPDAVRNQLALQGLTSFTVSRTDYDTGPTQQLVTNKTPRFVVGFEGSLGGSWRWDAHYSWAKNIFRSTISNDRIRANYSFAVDAVNSGGNIVCRATVPGPGFNPAAAGCVPFNIFGLGSPSQAAIDYTTTAHTATSDYWQDNLAVNLRGQPFSTWAGPVSIALGFEYRHERQVVETDPIATANGYQIGNGGPFSGSFNVTEGYAEVIVPLARDLPFAHSLDVNGAVRFADYSTSGSQTTWKVGATWEPTDGILLRATRSRDIRAPAISELFSPGAATNSTLTVLGKSGSVAANVNAGNPNLRPEAADTFAIGLVVEPVRGLRASVDYFDIDLSDAITSIPSGNVASLCNLGQQAFCDLFTFSPTGVPLTLLSPVTNAASIQTIGYDFALSYRTRMPEWFGSMPHSLALSASGTYVDHSYVDLGVGTGAIDRAGENGQTNVAAMPTFRGTVSATYTAGPAEMTLQAVYISSGTLDNTYNTTPSTTINDNSVPAVTYFNLFGRYKLRENMTLFASVRNLLDRDPPPIPHSTVLLPANGIYYDIVGRAYQMGITVDF